MECGVELAATEFAPELSPRHCHAGEPKQRWADLASICSVARRSQSFLWVIGGVLLGSVIPFTLIVILPINKQVAQILCTGQAVGRTERLLARWGMLHAVRSVLSGLALLLFLYSTIFRKSL